MTAPTLTLIAGANGSGKTTLTSDLWLLRGLSLLDPDAIGKTLQSTASSTSPIAAGRRVLQEAKRHIRNRESFAVETTLSGQGYLQMMLEREGLAFRSF